MSISSENEYHYQDYREQLYQESLERSRRLYENPSQKVMEWEYKYPLNNPQNSEREESPDRSVLQE